MDLVLATFENVRKKSNARVCVCYSLKIYKKAVQLACLKARGENI